MKQCAEKATVFISYSHRDAAWLEKLRTMLSPVVRKWNIDLWDDTRIRAGEQWKEEIRAALDRASVAVLLVSTAFLGSDFINENELPPILCKAQDGNVQVLWVLVDECMWEQTAISEYQAAHDPSEPVAKLREWKQNRVLKQVCEEIMRAVERHQKRCG